MSTEWCVKLDYRRPDGRKSNIELRPIDCEFNVIPSSSGSARFKYGHTSVVASINGPIEKSSRKGSIFLGDLSIIVRSEMGAVSFKEKYAEAILKNLFEGVMDMKFLIRTHTIISVQVEENHGGVLACMVNAIMCALLISGIPCTQTVLCVSLIPICDNNYNFAGCLIDPTLEELYSVKRTATDFYNKNISEYSSYVFNIHNKSLVKTIPEWTTGEQVCDQSFPTNVTTVIKIAEACIAFIKTLVYKEINSQLSQIPSFITQNSDS